MTEHIDRLHLIRAASELVSENGENPEYDRAITELTCDLLSVTTDVKEAVAKVIGVQRQAIEAWSRPLVISRDKDYDLPPGRTGGSGDREPYQPPNPDEDGM